MTTTVRNDMGSMARAGLDTRSAHDAEDAIARAFGLVTPLGRWTDNYWRHAPTRVGDPNPAIRNAARVLVSDKREAWTAVALAAKILRGARRTHLRLVGAMR